MWDKKTDWLTYLHGIRREISEERKTRGLSVSQWYAETEEELRKRGVKIEKLTQF